MDQPGRPLPEHPGLTGSHIMLNRWVRSCRTRWPVVPLPARRAHGRRRSGSPEACGQAGSNGAVQSRTSSVRMTAVFRWAVGYLVSTATVGGRAPLDPPIGPVPFCSRACSCHGELLPRHPGPDECESVLDLPGWGGMFGMRWDMSAHRARPTGTYAHRDPLCPSFAGDLVQETARSHLIVQRRAMGVGTAGIFDRAGQRPATSRRYGRSARSVIPAGRR